MRLKSYSLSLVALATVSLVGVALAPSAAADCNFSGGSTLCASGDVRGGSKNSPQSSGAPYSPYPCYDYGDPLCLYYDDYDPGIVFDLPDRVNRPVDPGFGRPGVSGRPGGGIGRN